MCMTILYFLYLGMEGEEQSGLYDSSVPLDDSVALVAGGVLFSLSRRTVQEVKGRMGCETYL